jgi:hypothetical protein
VTISGLKRYMPCFAQPGQAGVGDLPQAIVDGEGVAAVSEFFKVR